MCVRLLRLPSSAIHRKSNIQFVNSSERFEKLNAGDYDLLARNTTWTFSRDVDLGLSFQGVNYYDGQGFMVPASLGVSSAQLSWTAQKFVQVGTTTELNLADFFADNGMTYEPVNVSNSR